MSQVIYKYELPFGKVTILRFPGPYQIVLVDAQNDVPHMWVKHSTRPVLNTDPEIVFQVVPTEMAFPSNWAHVGSFQMRDDGLHYLVWHVVEVILDI